MDRKPAAVPEEFAPPVVVQCDEDLSSALASPAAALPPAPALPPLPAFGPDDLPAYEPFSYDVEARLTGSDLLAITEFHNKYLQAPFLHEQLRGLAAPDKARLEHIFYRDATSVLPLLERQYREACEGVGGERSQQAQQVYRNMDWTKRALAKLDAAWAQVG